ncbi:osmoprotectant transport system permease protein [Archangium gephyra]|uniref:L-proline glycine betaine binding ABC transporter protein ProX n=1 Tax=Archangium gephyra TaxID=48 RepID=A0AAC8Q2W4_9BACT|nr:glycine betaine ABC transporter substrate-binding protein [Archangium gephyra]AKI99908.1 L-proline glycine betaine binding ABC transporter protein ProX [Archangium gephyra]REG33379.1 osmoprotectant transport system permease protein [Archangium gephyra]
MRALAAAAVWLVLAACAGAPPEGTAVRVGSKKFTESVILGDMVTQLARSTGARAEHRRELGGTQVLWQALRRGELDLYPEYTGTLRQELFAGRALPDDESLRQALAAEGLRMSAPLGFNDTYALGMKEAEAERLGIRTLSDLREHPELRFGFSNEFMDRGDGWPALRSRYALPQREVRGLDHDLAYRGLESGAIQVTDLYSTDAEIAYYGLRVLEDDLRHFPAYDAVLLYREDLAGRAPEVVTALGRLEGRISEREMVELNARAKLQRVPEPQVAAAFLERELGLTVTVRGDSLGASLWLHTREHLFLVGLSLLAAIAVAVPLGVLVARRPRLGQGVLALAGIIQTVPSLALLVFMIPLLGIGARPAIVALFLYSLLPILRNTAAGLTGIAPEVRESAEALGLPPGARLRLVELPMAAPSILAGIQTSAVINVGTATLGALIGAGGYGQPILTGIRLDDTSLILQGAVPAAVLALLVSGLFELIERLVVPRGLRL